MFKSVRTRLFASYVLVVVFTLTAIGLLLSAWLIPRLQDQLTLAGLRLAFQPTALHLRAEMLRNVQSPDRDRLLAVLQTSVAEIGEERGVRLLVLTPQRRVLADSDETLRGQVVNLASSELRWQSGQAQGVYELPDGQEILWIGGPIELARQPESEPDQRPQFLLVLAQSPRESALLSKSLRNQFLIAGAAGLALALLLALWISRSIARPLQQVAQAAEEVARGNYDLDLEIAAPEEMHSVAASFNAMIQAVKNSQQAQRDFVANVSHELKTPLTSIRGFSQALLDGTAGDAEAARQAAEVIHEEAGRMGRMVEQLLDLARIESGQIVMGRETVNLRALLEGCVEKLRPQAAGSDVALAADLEDLGDGIRVVGDGDRLAQVFIVLLDNALKYTPSGGRVNLAAGQTEDARLAVSVSDTGPGIPAEELSRIFERFYQVDKSRAGERGGAGLGLAIAREIVTAHGGEIVAESIMGMGSKFTVRLPFAEQQFSIWRHGIMRAMGS